MPLITITTVDDNIAMIFQDALDGRLLVPALFFERSISPLLHAFAKAAISLVASGKISKVR